MKKSRKRTDFTPKGIITSALRLVWMRCRERATALKRDNNTCQVCGAKKSVAKGREVKVECHHIKGEVNWDRILRVIREELLCEPKDLMTLCVKCHDDWHRNGEI